MHHRLKPVDLYSAKVEEMLVEDEVLSAEQLFDGVWKQTTFDYDKTLRKRVSELRGKLEEHTYSHTIKAVYGKGYRFEKRTDMNVED